jgi:hypothetical protein
MNATATKSRKHAKAPAPTEAQVEGLGLLIGALDLRLSDRNDPLAGLRRLLDPLSTNERPAYSGEDLRRMRSARRWIFRTLEMNGHDVSGVPHLHDGRAGEAR